MAEIENTGCGCPPGFELLKDTDICQKISTNTVIVPTNPIPIGLPETSGLLIKNGAVIYEDITDKQWPLIATPQVGGVNGGLLSANSIIPSSGVTNFGSYSSISPAGTPRHSLVNTALPSPWPPGVYTPPLNIQQLGNFKTAFRESVITSDVLYLGTGATIVPQAFMFTAPWRDGSFNGDNWFNKIGVWSANTVSKEWYGFTQCVEIDEEKTYYIAFAGNNAIRFFIDGIFALEMNVGDGEVQTLGFANIIPVTLKKGTHIFTVEGLNYSAGGGVAFEIYDTDLSTLIAVTTLVDLHALTIFSTLDKRPLAGISATTTATSFTISNPSRSFVSTDVGLLIIASGILPSGTRIVSVDINTNTAIVDKAAIASGVNSFALNHVFETSTHTGDGYSCPTGYIFSNCDGPACIKIETTVFTTCCFKLTSCIDGSEIIASNPELAEFEQNNSVISFSLDPNNLVKRICYSVSIVHTCSEAGEIFNIVATIPVEGVSDCDTCRPKSYLLRNCEDEENELTTSSDFSAIEIGQIVRLEEYPELCWELIAIEHLQDQPLVTITDTFEDCSTCLPKCYVLTDCADPAREPRSTTQNLSSFIGKVIKYKDSCWTVSEQIHCNCDIQETIEDIVDFDTCELCNAVPEVVLVPTKKFIEPGYITLNCDPEYVIKTNCQFGEAYYKNMVAKRYGINIMGQEDLDEVWLNKEMVDLAEMTDPEYCFEPVVVVPVVCP